VFVLLNIYSTWMEWLFLYLLFDTSYRLKVLSGYRYRDMNADTVCNLRPCPLFLWYIHGQMYCQVLQPIHGQMYCQVLQCTIKLVDTSWSMLCIYWHKRILLIIVRDQIGTQLSTQMKFNINVIIWCYTIRVICLWSLKRCVMHDFTILYSVDIKIQC